MSHPEDERPSDAEFASRMLAHLPKPSVSPQLLQRVAQIPLAHPQPTSLTSWLRWPKAWRLGVPSFALASAALGAIAGVWTLQSEPEVEALAATPAEPAQLVLDEAQGTAAEFDHLLSLAWGADSERAWDESWLEEASP